jgi:hypothetical protein
VERGKVEKFISGAKCRRTYLDQEMDGRVDRGRCEEGEERCDVCQKDDAELAEVEELRETYIREQEQRVMQERENDSGIGMTSSSPHVAPTSDDAFPTSRNIDVAISRADQEEFQAQQAERAQQWACISEASQEEARAVWDLENQLDKWIDKCLLCYVRQHTGQQVEVQHTLDECADELQPLVVQEVSGLAGIRFERFASCYPVFRAHTRPAYAFSAAA